MDKGAHFLERRHHVHIELPIVKHCCTRQAGLNDLWRRTKSQHELNGREGGKRESHTHRGEASYAFMRLWKRDRSRQANPHTLSLARTVACAWRAKAKSTPSTKVTNRPTSAAWGEATSASNGDNTVGAPSWCDASFSARVCLSQHTS